MCIFLVFFAGTYLLFFSANQNNPDTITNWVPTFINVPLVSHYLVMNEDLGVNIVIVN